MERKKIALISHHKKTKQQLWYVPSPSKNEEKIITLLENGKKYFQQHFIDETLDLTVKEFKEIVHVFEKSTKMKNRFKHY